MSSSSLALAGLVLCGGHSRRMGRSKAALPFGDETMLTRTLRLLGQAASPLAAAAAERQELPELPAEVSLVYDRNPDRGPLEGLRAGLAHFAARRDAGEAIDAVYAASCDAPMLQPAFVKSVADALGDAQIAVPVEGRFPHPLAAVYRLEVLPTIERLLAEDRLRPFFLFQEVETQRIDVEYLRKADPELQTLRNLNRPEDYEAALAEAGL